MDIDDNSLIRDLCAMVEIPSVNPFGDADPARPAEESMAQYVESRLRELGLTTDSRIVSDGRRNVWGRLSGSGNGPTLMLAAHLDTVGVAGYDTAFNPDVRDGRVYGRGSCDMKAGFAAYFEVLRILVNSGDPLAGDLIVAGVVDEEHAMLGSADFGQHGPPVDAAIIAEPSSLAICPAHKGQVCLTIRTHGRSTHSSMPDNGINAIYHMSAAIEALQGYAAMLSQRPADPLCGKPTFSIGVVRGGENVSTVPDWCDIEIDRRTVPGESCQTVIDELQSVLAEVANSRTDCGFELMPPSLNVPPLSTESDSPLVRSLVSACQEVLSDDPKIQPFPGSTDAPNFGCPAVICGAGALEQCHSLNEYVPIAEIRQAVGIYLRTLRLMQSQVV